MKYIINKYSNIFLILALVLFTNCQDDDSTFGAVIAPTNIQVTSEIVGQDSANPYGDGSGMVNFKATANNAINYTFAYNSNKKTSPIGEAEMSFSNLGVNSYDVVVTAFGTGGTSSSVIVTVEVLATYSPPAELLDKLVGDGSKTWRLKSEKAGHFGLGPVGGQIPTEWYAAGPNEKVGVGMYDDRFIFDADGTFTHITNNTNDDPNQDPTGTVFGRDGLVNQLGPGSGTLNGADVENFPYNDYSETWALIAPGGQETISLTGLGFISYYCGGSHNYQIFDRSVPNELLLKTTDGNGEFDWWFIITSLEEGEDDGDSFTSQYNNLVWEDDFDTNGAPDASKWTYDLGAGGWGNQELQTYTEEAENVIVEDGFLKITAKENGSSYSSARIKTEGLFDFTYGRVEVRAKLPASIGTWPAIWMLGADYETNIWPACGEVDIMEQTGQDKNVVLSTVHHPAVSPGAGDSSGISATTSTTEFHNYTLEWTPDELIFLIDDSVIHTVTNNSGLPFNNDFFLILNVAMGGTLGGTVDPAFVEDSMEVDYVRVYQ
ncbi:family 16 glycosylhydrolase [Corallibacter sp.]|uniref:glycoside hydrolase family 16 protein n=1 Tax=Corallibacter sp. TaxID=2038084 RepID=UPI003A8DD7D2